MSATLSGLRAWVVQRVSAGYMVLFVSIMPFYIISQEELGYTSWRTLLAAPMMTAIWALFFFAMLIHAWVGMRDIIIDYVHLLAARIIVLLILALVLGGLLVWVMRILLLNIGAAT